MRLVQLTIPAGKRDAILNTLDDEGIDYVVTDETSGREFTGVVYFPLPTNAVEPVLDSLQDVGVGEDAYTVVVDAETVISRKFERLEEEYASDDLEEERISRQELRTQAQELTPSLTIFVTMTLISAMVATAGLLLDSPAVVVGSMVIAPLIGPALAASVGTVIHDQELARKGLTYQVLGVVIAIVGATILAWIIKTTHLVPPGIELASVGEIRERLSPGVLSLVVALGAGVAGILSLSTGISVALVGVMIAAALIPPAAAAGIAIAWGQPMAALGSTVLVFVTILSVNLAGLVTLWYTGYRPDQWFEEASAQREMLRNVAVFAVAMLALSTFLVGITYTSYQTATFENEVQQDLQETIDGPQHEQYRLLSVETELNENYPFRQQELVIVTVGSLGEGSSQGLTNQIYAIVDEHSNREVAVQVRYVDIEERGDVPTEETDESAASLAAGGPSPAATADPDAPPSPGATAPRRPSSVARPTPAA